MSTEKKPLQLGSLVKTSKTSPAKSKVADKSELTAITVKLDKERYRALKLLALDSGKTSQAVMVQALDLLLSSK